MRLSRIKKHIELGTWHNKYDKTIIDVDILGHITASDEFWDDGIDEVINGVPARTTDLNFITASSVPEEDDSSSYNLGKRSLVNDLNLMNVPNKDAWFDRRVFNSSYKLYDVVNLLKLENEDARLAVQHPLDGASLHIDHEHQQCFEPEHADDRGHLFNKTIKDADEVSRDTWDVFVNKDRMKKFIIALKDFEPGAVLICGNTVVPQLKRGDLISIPNNVPHWSSNFSDKKRYTIMITGQYNPGYFKWAFNYTGEYCNTVIPREFIL